jgi:hypothetical protein
VNRGRFKAENERCQDEYGLTYAAFLALSVVAAARRFGRTSVCAHDVGRLVWSVREVPAETTTRSLAVLERRRYARAVGRTPKGVLYEATPLGLRLFAEFTAEEAAA